MFVTPHMRTCVLSQRIPKHGARSLYFNSMLICLIAGKLPRPFAYFTAVGRSLYALAISGVPGLSDCDEGNLALMVIPCLSQFEPMSTSLSVLVIVACGLL